MTVLAERQKGAREDIIPPHPLPSSIDLGLKNTDGLQPETLYNFLALRTSDGFPTTQEELSRRLYPGLQNGRNPMDRAWNLTLATRGNLVVQLREKGAPVVVAEQEGGYYVRFKQGDGLASREKRFITLTDADIESIINPPAEKRKLDEADMRILGALMKTDFNKKLSAFAISKLIEPEKGLASPEARNSVPLRIRFYNEVLLGRMMHVEALEASQSYYLTDRFRPEVTTGRKIAYLKERIAERVKVEKWDHIEYRLVHGKVNDGEVALVVTRGREQTTTVRFYNLDYQDPEAPRTPGEKQPVYVLEASKLVKLMELLFQAGPVPVRVAKNKLGDDSGYISTRELQLYINVLNGNLRVNRDGRNNGIKMSRSAITQLGLGIGHGFLNSLGEIGEAEVEKDEKGEEVIFLEKYPPASAPSELLDQYDRTTFYQGSGAKPKRKRGPSTGNGTIRL